MPPTSSSSMPPGICRPRARNARAEYLAEHIPGALFFDIDEIADTKSHLPHMLPPPEKFSSRMRSMGIGDGSRIVVYDSTGLFSAARVWWTFRVMGVQDVSVLNGGLPKWKREGHAARKWRADGAHCAAFHGAAQCRSRTRSLAT